MLYPVPLVNEFCKGLEMLEVLHLREVKALLTIVLPHYVEHHHLRSQKQCKVSPHTPRKVERAGEEDGERERERERKGERESMCV